MPLPRFSPVLRYGAWYELAARFPAAEKYGEPLPEATLDLIRQIEGTSADVHDSQAAAALVQGDEQVVIEFAPAVPDDAPPVQQKLGFEPADLLDIIGRERIDTMFMVPTILNAINRIPGIEARRFPHLKCMLVSAAPISDETALKAYDIFGDAMYQGYGQTEVLPVAMMGPRQWFAKDVPGSQPLRACGMPIDVSSYVRRRMRPGWRVVLRRDAHPINTTRTGGWGESPAHL